MIRAGGQWWGSLPGRARWLLGVGLLGLVVRWVVAGLSSGSNDVHIWGYFAQFIERAGLTATYLQLDGRPGSPVPVFNHPPLPALWVWACSRLADLSGIRFPILLKGAGILAEFGTASLLWRIWSKRTGPEQAAAAVAAYGFALCAILVSGYHGNTDAVYAFLLLLAVYCFDAGRPFLAGAVIAGALNIKLIPLFAVPALLAACRDWKTFFRLSAGLALAIVPFLPFLFIIPREFFRNVFAYTPNLDFWGVIGLLRGAEQTPRFRDVAPAGIAFYVAQYRYFLLLAICGAALWARRRKLELGVSMLISMCLFMILTPGFGVQYTVVICPLMFAVSYRWGLAWSWVAGLFIFVPYYAFFEGRTPWHSTFTGPYPMPAPMIGLVAWALLIQLVGSLLSAPVQRAPPTPS